MRADKALSEGMMLGVIFGVLIMLAFNMATQAGKTATSECINLDTFTEVRMDLIPYGKCLCEPETQDCFCYPI